MPDSRIIKNSSRLELKYREKPHALKQRVARIQGLFQYARIELQQAQLSVDVQRRLQRGLRQRQDLFALLLNSHFLPLFTSRPYL